VYYAYNELQGATQAAALAGAMAISNPTLTTPGASAPETPGNFASYYGSQTGAANTHPILTSGDPSNVTQVQTTVYLMCNTFVENTLNISCVTYNGGGTAKVNAVQVVQTAYVKTFFAGLFGTSAVELTSTATAARAGAPATPYNIAIVVDSTESMTTSDTGTGCVTPFGSGHTRFQCALDGVQVLLSSLAPCYSNESTCGAATDGLTSTSVDRVALFTFPNMSTATIPDEYCDGGSKDTTCASSGTPGTGCLNTKGSICVQAYTYPTSTGTSYTAVGSTSYLVSYASGGLGSGSNGFVNDYEASNGASTLSSTSDLVKAVGASSTSTPDMAAEGGAGTYYAGIIYAAEAALYAEQKANPNSQNVLIVLSDGEASATCAGMASSNNGYTLNGTKGVSGCASGGNTSTAYPSYLAQCTQAVNAASSTSNTSAARASISRIYGIAYGSETGNCPNDTISPCQTIQGIASSSNYFYSDYAQSGGGQDTTCVGSANSTTNLATIFSDIASDFFSARLIPNSEFPTPSS
jgi:hypothetical protein